MGNGRNGWFSAGQLTAAKSGYRTLALWRDLAESRLTAPGVRGQKPDIRSALRDWPISNSWLPRRAQTVLA